MSNPIGSVTIRIGYSPSGRIPPFKQSHPDVRVHSPVLPGIAHNCSNIVSAGKTILPNWPEYAPSRGWIIN